MIWWWEPGQCSIQLLRMRVARGSLHNISIKIVNTVESTLPPFTFIAQHESSR